MSFVLKKVQMKPAILLRIIDITVTCVAGGTSIGVACRKIKCMDSLEALEQNNCCTTVVAD
jgi:hypothetical protein